jgi:hypothetical protein
MTPAQQQRFEAALGACRVLAVGVSSQLPDSGLPSLVVCANDARDFVDAFRLRSQLNADQEFCQELSSPDRPPTKAVIVGQLKKLAREAKRDSRLLFYFSGHGVRLADELFLVPQDACSAEDADTLLAFGEVKNIINESPAKQKLIILDACHSGPATDRFKSPFTVSHGFLERYLKTTCGCAILAASESRQRANVRSPDSKHSLFTYHLLRALHGDVAALEEGLLTLYGLHRYLSTEVPRSARSDNRSTPQKPVLESSTTGDLLLGDFRNASPWQNAPNTQTKSGLPATSAISMLPQNQRVISGEQAKDSVAGWRADQFLRSITSLQTTGETHYRRLDAYSSSLLDLPPATLADAAEKSVLPEGSNPVKWPAVLSRFSEVEHEVLSWGARWEYAQGIERGFPFYEFVAAHQTGRIFLLETQGPRVPQPTLYADDAIGATYDAIRFSVNFFRNIDLDEREEVTVGLEWGGLKGYRVMKHENGPNMEIRGPRVCKTNDPVGAELRFRLADWNTDLANKVQRLLVRTFNIFDRYNPSLAVYEEVLVGWKRR